MVGSLTEQEALYLAVVFEETGAYQYKKNKEIERQSSGSGGSGETGKKPGLEPGFEEIFSFGEDDPNDYWSGTDCNDCADPHDFST